MTEYQGKKRKLAYKTRGTEAPHSRPRVYYCGAKDSTRWFLRITEEVLNYRPNCVIWYPLSENAPAESEENSEVSSDKSNAMQNGEEAVTPDLSEMQLFLLPVTKELLDGEDPCLEEALYAIGECIPVLPFLFGTGLEAEYTRVFGNLQYLQVLDDDGTAIPYEKKLEKRLASILLGDKEIEEIRAAFRKRIFLSYRKKDRALAQRLMRLIHKDPRFRDVATWYDEFLIPGKDFRELIMKQLDSCDLFALAVTPLLLESGNFVLTEEYPAARGVKPILPAMLEETDVDALNENFADLPPVVDAESEQALGDALEAALSAGAGDGLRNDRKYLLGLAYLSGVDVEVDHRMGVALITEAAEAGKPEAMQKLSAIYRNGEGTPRDYDRAVLWGCRLVDHYRAVFRILKLTTTAADYLIALLELTILCLEVGRGEALFNRLPQTLEDLESVLAMMPLRAELKFGEEYERLFAKPIAEIGQWKENGPVTDEELRKLELRASREFPEEVAKIRACRMRMEQHFKEIEKKEPSLLVSALASVYKQIAGLHARNNDPTRAIEFYERAAKVTLMHTDSEQRTSGYADLLLTIGETYLRSSRPLSAEPYFRKSLKLTEAYQGGWNPVLSQRRLAEIYQSLAEASRKHSDAERTEEYFDLALQARKAVYTATASESDGTSLGRLLDTVAGYMEAEGRLDEALAFLTESLDLFEHLAENRKTPSLDLHAAMACHEISKLLDKKKDTAEATEYRERAFDGFTHILPRTLTMLNRASLMNELDLLALELCLAGDVKRAKLCMLRSEAVSRSGLRLSTDSYFRASQRQHVRCSIAFYREVKDHMRLHEFRMEDLALETDRLTRERGTFEERLALAREYAELGREKSVMNDPTEAKRLFEEASARLLDLFGESGRIELSFERLYPLVALASLADEANDTVTVGALLDEAYTICETLDRDGLNYRLEQNVRTVFRKYAAFYLENGDRESLIEAKRSAMRAFELDREVWERGKRTDDLYDPVESCGLLGRICEAQGAKVNLQDAKGYYRQMLDYADIFRERGTETVEALLLLGEALYRVALSKGVGRKKLLKQALNVLRAARLRAAEDPQVNALIEKVESALAGKDENDT